MIKFKKPFTDWKIESGEVFAEYPYPTIWVSQIKQYLVKNPQVPHYIPLPKLLTISRSTESELLEKLLDDYSRVDISIPIILYVYGGKTFLVDGYHRLAHAYYDNIKGLPAVIVTYDQCPDAIMGENL